jgi:hypothetical protein
MCFDRCCAVAEVHIYLLVFVALAVSFESMPAMQSQVAAAACPQLLTFVMLSMQVFACRLASRSQAAGIESERQSSTAAAAALVDPAVLLV